MKAKKTMAEITDFPIKTESIDRLLTTKSIARNIIYLETTGSSNDDCALLGRQGAPHGSLVIAEKQEKGKGRRGRTWVSPPFKNIFMSLLVRPNVDPANVSMLTLVFAISVCEGIKDVTGVSPSIKWPNDAVINGHKIVGILTELHMKAENPGQIDCVVIGTGINVNQESFDDAIRATAGSLFTETGRSVDRNKVIAAVMNHFEEDYDLYLQKENLELLKDKYESMLINLGREVRVIDPKGDFTGVSRGITDTGELIVETASGIRAINSGEVSVRGLYGYV